VSWREILADASVPARSAAREAASDQVRYFEVPTRRLLNPVRSRGDPSAAGASLPFELTANPFLHCEVGCVYCHARDFADRRAGGKADFDGQIFAKTGAVAALRDEMARLVRSGQQGKAIALGTATDPYQPLERRLKLTRGLLEVLAGVSTQHGGVRLSITTKCDLALRDLDLFQELGRRGTLQVNVSLSTTDRGLAKLLEPKAPSPGRRLKLVESLARAGVPVGVYLMPILPGITDSPREVRASVWAARTAGARFLTARTLVLPGAARDSFFAWLERERPDLVKRYRRWYRTGPYVREDVEDRLRRLVEALRRQVGLPAGLELPTAAPAAREQQLTLFDLAGASRHDPGDVARRLPGVDDPSSSTAAVFRQPGSPLSVVARTEPRRLPVAAPQPPLSIAEPVQRGEAGADVA